MKNLRKKTPNGRLGKGVRFSVGQNDHTGSGGWHQKDRGAIAGICAVMIDEVCAADVASEPAKCVMQILKPSGLRAVRADRNLRAM